MGCKERFRSDRGYKDPKDLPKGPDGRPLCRFCNQETKPPRRTFCSEECIHNFRVQSSGSYAREQVFQRDRGICASCGLDTEKLKQLVFKVRTEKGEEAYKLLIRSYRLKYGFGFELDKHYWEADHVLAVALGGGSSTLDNLKTLCRICHRKKTRQDMKKIKRQKRSFGRRGKFKPRV